jgi:hypothetical protein
VNSEDGVQTDVEKWAGVVVDPRWVAISEGEGRVDETHGTVGEQNAAHENHGNFRLGPKSSFS